MSIHRFIVSATTNSGRVALLERLGLDRRRGVGQEDVARVAVALGHLRVEVLEHVEVRVERVARVPVGLVAPGPAEGLAVGDLDAARVDAVRLEPCAVIRT